MSGERLPSREPETVPADYDPANDVLDVMPGYAYDRIGGRTVSYLTRKTLFGRDVCEYCGYGVPQHSEDCDRPFDDGTVTDSAGRERPQMDPDELAEVEEPEVPSGGPD